MQNDKISTYLGFCIRSGKIVFGVDRAEALKKGVHLLIADSTLSENSMKVLVKLKEKFSCPLLVTEGVSLSELLHRPAVKAAAVKDKNLASAILTASASDAQYKLYSGGNN
ncbi:MAG: hypothetical protein ACLR3U_01020 [Christensenellaceae bacterium]|nr:hypothetical protein [Clostridia bacterium]PWL99570.1 MAG: hypothetical protein DBY05_08295 [Clostridiales bacterium]